LSQMKDHSKLARRLMRFGSGRTTGRPLPPSVGYGQIVSGSGPDGYLSVLPGRGTFFLNVG